MHTQQCHRFLLTGRIDYGFTISGLHASWQKSCDFCWFSLEVFWNSLNFSRVSNHGFLKLQTFQDARLVDTALQFFAGGSIISLILVATRGRWWEAFTVSGHGRHPQTFRDHNCRATFPKDRNCAAFLLMMEQAVSSESPYIFAPAPVSLLQMTVNCQISIKSGLQGRYSIMVDVQAKAKKYNSLSPTFSNI